VTDYLTQRGGSWHFVRRVPDEYAHIDGRGVIKLATGIRCAGKISRIRAQGVARTMNKALGRYWESGATTAAKARFKQDIKKARNLNEIYEPEPAHSAPVSPISQTLVDNLVMLAKAYAKATSVKITTVGTNSTKTATFYVDLESGKTSCTLRKYDILTAWFAENWPEGHTMPMLTDPQHYPAQGDRAAYKDLLTRVKALEEARNQRA
jgi:hypothetical protein